MDDIGQPAPVIAYALGGLTRRRVEQLATQGVIERSARGLYPLFAATRGYIAYLQHGLSRPTKGSAVNDERARLLRLQVEKAEIELGVMRAELVRVDHTREVLERYIGSCRKHLLAIPTRVAPIITTPDRIEEVRSLIETEVHAALRELAGCLESDEEPGSNLAITLAQPPEPEPEPEPEQRPQPKARRAPSRKPPRAKPARAKPKGKPAPQ